MNPEKTIFIIDDDPVQNEVHTLLLGKAFPGYRIKTFTGFTEALKALADEPPALIFADLNVPGLSLEEFLRQHREQACQADIYLISALPYLNNPQLLTAYPAVRDFISKPLLPEKLTAALGNPV